MSEENKPQDEEVIDEAVKKAADEGVDDRPDINYKAELERKNRELERMREELSRKAEVKPTYNPNDITTWPDHELRALMKDPKFSQYHDQAEDVLFERKMEAKLARREEANKRVTAEMQLREKFPEALDSNSALAARMEQIMHENDLAKTPAGRLVAAKLAAAELNQGKDSSAARAQKAEKDRLARVKGQLVDGDRAKPADNPDANLESKRKELSDKLIKGKGADQVDAVSQYLKSRGMTQENFFKK